MEVWQMLIAVGAFLTPIVLAAFARDRSLFQMMASAKQEMASSIKAAVDPIHERINRVRDEYVREDHLNAHLGRIDKRFDDLSSEMRRRGENTDKKLDEIRNLIQPR